MTLLRRLWCALIGHDEYNTHMGQRCCFRCGRFKNLLDGRWRP